MTDKEEKVVDPALDWRRFWWGLRYFFWSTEAILAEEKRIITTVKFNLAYDIKQAIRESEWTMSHARTCMREHTTEAAKQHLQAYAQQLVGVARLRSMANRLDQLHVSLSVNNIQVHMMKSHESLAFAMEKWSDKDSIEARSKVMKRLADNLADTREILAEADHSLEYHQKETETTVAAVEVTKPIDVTVDMLMKQLEQEEDDLAALPKVARRKPVRSVQVRQ
jgi:acyl-CoA reductase-like NAD-dependent aldehyde dehydrogenase